MQEACLGWENGMTEIDIEDKISKFWGKKCSVLEIDQQDELNEILDKLSNNSFTNAEKNNPVSAFEFASWLNTENLKDFFKKNSYKNFNIVENRLGPRIRFIAAMCLGKYETIIDTYRTMIANEYWNILGFSIPPTYEILREFINERIGVERLQEFFDFLIIELVRQAKLNNIQLGRRIGQDATDTDCLKYDKEAKYSGYYKHTGYKVDVTHDLDDSTVPLDYTPMELTDDEGKNLIPAQERLRQKGISIDEQKVDGSYVKSYENIAKSETKGTKLIYKIQDGWVYNKKGTEENVKRVYQKYHNDEGFRVNACNSYMLNFLCKKGEYEVVGAHYRNQRMTYTETNPELAKKETGERSCKTEGYFSVEKSTTILDSRPRRRGGKEFVRRCGISMLSHIFAALIRIQHGIKTALGCVTYIT
jgi:hypothetical protein